MQNKQIVFTDINKAELIAKEIRNPEDNEVLVELRYSAISSGTERANITGEPNVNIYETCETAKFPRYGGYSSSGIVIKKGKNVNHVNIGDEVALKWSLHEKYHTTDEKNVFPLSGVSLLDGALCNISTFSMAAIRKCRLEMGESTVVMGLGILGMLAIPLLRTSGAYPIIAVDPIKEKREKALTAGADYALDPFSDSFRSDVLNITSGGANVAIEVTGNGSALVSLLGCMKKLGRVALLGCTRNSDFTLDYYHLVHGPGVSLIGAHTLARPKVESSCGYFTAEDDMRCAVNLLRGGRIDFGQFVERIESPACCAEVYLRLATEPAFKTTVFDWSLI